MLTLNLISRWTRLAILGALIIWIAGEATAQTVKTLHSFARNGKDGYTANNNLVFDSAGNLYGVTFNGGVYGFGTVFELSPKSGGGWTEKILHSFADNGIDGFAPNGPLILDSAGNLYGTTSAGGPKNAGVVFELVRSSGGSFSESILYSFKGYTKATHDGVEPWSSLVFDSKGNLYSTTRYGGANNQGTVFELSPASGGKWTEKILYSFSKTGASGCDPLGGLLRDSSGNFFGTTNGCGTTGYGNVFELSLVSSTWTETVLHSFAENSTDGGEPNGTLVSDSLGNLYGTAGLGINSSWGMVYELTPQSGGTWQETVLHSFTGGTDGATVSSSVTLDASGNVWGTTQAGGSKGHGTLFELTSVLGGWNETVVHNFVISGSQPYFPSSSVIFDASGNAYGVTNYGGSADSGTVYEVIP